MSQTFWTSSQDIRNRLKKRWEKGEFLTQLISDTFVPLRIPLKHPTAKELAHQFEAARDWINEIIRHAGNKDKSKFVIEWKETNHRTLGKNKTPKAVVFETLEDILSYLGKTKEADTYQKLFKQITAKFPEISENLAKKPWDVLKHAGAWNQLLDVIDYIKKNPRPDIYIRQLEISGVDTKFIEHHKPILTKLLTQVLPPDAVNNEAKGKSVFEKRFGFCCKPTRIRFRPLDPDLSFIGVSDFEIPAVEFGCLPKVPDTVFIIENEITFLAFPAFPGAIVIFGKGYSLSVLSDIPWMKDKKVWYWSDIDTHGFVMIDQLRHYFPKARSFLMDEATLLSHRNLWVQETAATSRDLLKLTPDESKVYNALRYNDHAPNLRLEQERISFSRVRQVIEEIRAETSL